MQDKELFEILAEYVAATRKVRSAKTVSVYRTSIVQLSKATGIDYPRVSDLSDPALIALERWMESRGRSPATINERTGRIKSLWRFAARKGYCKDWPTADRLPVPEPDRRAWTKSELATLFAAAGVQDGFVGPVPASIWWVSLLRVAWETAERSGALLAMQPQHFSVERGGLDLPAAIRKGRKAAYHPLSPATAGRVAELIGYGCDRIFHWPSSPPFSAYHEAFNQLLRSAGLPTGRRNQLQKIRRTSLTFWVAGGGDATAKATHSDPATTQRHYIDRSLLPMERPEEILPDI